MSQVSTHLTEHTAVLLNANAKQVSPRVHQALSGLVPAGSLFLSRSPGDAPRIADTVMSRGFSTVFTGGGDGTFMSWVNHILDRAETRHAPAPQFGILALGTGNAVAGMVGAGRAEEDLRRFLRGGVPSARRLDLVMVEGHRTPFASVGLDAAVLNDYRWLRDRLGGRARRIATGLRGYGLAIALRSAPRQLFQRSPVYAEVVNVGGPAWRLDPAGARVGRPVETGEMLYAGPLMLAAGSTVPYYGFGLRAFPFAGRRAGHMHFRVFTRIPVTSLVANVGPIFRGDFRHPGLLDFEVQEVEITADRPVPFQSGGDAGGDRDRVRMGMAPRSVALLDYTAPGSLVA